MSKSIKATLLLIAIAAILAFARPASESTADIVVGSADTLRQEGLAASSALDISLAGVTTRVIVEFANTVRLIALTAPTDDLVAKLDAVQTRIVTEFANSLRQEVLHSPPPEMSVVLGQVTDRIVFEFANSNRETALAYPKPLINDTTSPAISEPTANGTKIVWTTDEFTSSLVRYGSDPSVLDQTIADPFFTKAHELTLPSPGAGATLYYQIVSTDLSGNQTTSPVYKLTAEQRLYLPSVRRNS